MDDVVMSEAEISEVFTVPWEIFAEEWKKTPHNKGINT